MITLYHCDAARSFRPLWMLEELGLPYELKMLPFPPRVFAKDYLALNPLGTIPFMIDGETRMTESSGICHYLGIKYGPTPLMVGPDDAAYGAFLNWMTPESAATSRENVHGGAANAGREPPQVLGYVRTAIGEDAAERLAKEESFYRDLHDGYRRQFDRLGAPEGTVGVAAADRDGAQAELERYEALDVIVVRGLASATLEDMGAVAAGAAPA